MTREELELTDIRDFTTLFYVILSPPVDLLRLKTSLKGDLCINSNRDFS